MKLTTVDDYIASAPKDAQAKAKEIRELIKKAAPDAEEKLSYGMPYYGYHGRLVYFGIFKTHIGMYVMDAAKEANLEAIKPYHKSKATLHFKLDQPLPKKLITDLVKAQVAANKANK